ncbi:uncharacterized protein LOC110443287 [Mizuhopecten yessoensis]|uniref:uncharacterized protein LOC110443287 n=1 Tax=Mizuhopecten yessoensis TaxID=6573 RepID=UPI000B45CE51|nr:uncharacterized protein LOC110443287 [Mizuhopecten yessoensis]
MKRSQKLGLIMTAVSLLLVCITFCTPGMYIVRIAKDKKVQTEQEVVVTVGNTTVRRYEPVTISIPTSVTLSCGLWYFSACVPNYCDVHSYQHAKHAARHFDEALQGMDMDKIYDHLGEIAKFAFTEFQVEITVSMVCLVISLVTTMCYFRGRMSRRCLGLTAFITTLLPGILLAVATAKCVALILMSRVLLGSAFDFDMSKVAFRFPYSLLLSAIAAFFLFGSSLSLLLTITDKKTLLSDKASYSVMCNEKSRDIPSNMVSPADSSLPISVGISHFN